MPQFNSGSTHGSAKASHRVVFDSDDSSASDGEGHETSGNALARDMAAAAERERRKNPHAESGRAKRPRAHPLAPSVAKATPTVAAHKSKKKMDLFGSDSSSSSSSDTEENGDATATPPPSAAAAAAARGTRDTSASKTAHVRGLSLRAVEKGDATATRAPVSDDEGSDHKEVEEEESGVSLRINKAYATRYEEQKRKQELHTLAEKYKGKLGKAAAWGLGGDGDGEDDDDGGDDDSSAEDEAEEDDDAVLLTRENKLRFAKALLAVRKATVPLRANADGSESASSPATAPPLLPKEALLSQRFFPSAEEQIRANTAVFERRVERRRSRAGGSNHFTLSDEYQRALRATAESEEAVVEDEAGERDGLRKLRPQNAAEAKLRAAFLRDVEDSANTFEVVRSATAPRGTAAATDDGGSDGDADAEEQRLLSEAFSLSTSATKRAATAAASTTRAREGPGGDEAGSDEADTAEDGEAFLRDFFIQELWRPGAARSAVGGTAQEEEEEGESYHTRLAQLAREEEDEAFFNDAEVWEREYQEKKYRHQEAEEEDAAAAASGAASRVQTFPRPIGEAATGLLRKPDTARKDARQRRRERAEAARAQQVEELKRLKHLKRREIEDQRALIASVAGLTAASGGGGGGGGGAEAAELAKLKAVWSDKDLDAPFDPAEFDRKMALLFNDDYYDEAKVDEEEIAFFDDELDKAGDNEGEDGAAAADVRAGAAPALFAANSLEEAQAMALVPPAGASAKEKKGTRTEVFFNDDFGPASSGDGGDVLSLLYPSEALQKLEKERQELNDLIAASATAAPTGKGETNAELLERLQASLKQKEEEYFELHRNAGGSGGAAGGSGGGGGGFRYREVPPEDFTLSIEEILALDDRQLNVIAPMNCYAAYLDKDSNERDRRRIERRREKGLRQVDSDRTSRRYGAVKNTALLNPDLIGDEEGEAIAANLSKRLREEGGELEAPYRQRGRGDGPSPAASRGAWPRAESRGRGGRSGRGGRGGRGDGAEVPRGGYRGRGSGRGGRGRGGR